MLKLRLISIMFGFICCVANAESKSDLVKAQELYQKGSYREAATAYLALEHTHSHASVLHNLGLSFYRAGDYGAAVAAYLRAAQLQPRDPDIHYNLQFLLKKATDKLEPILPRTLLEKSMLFIPLSLKERFYVLCGSIVLLSLGTGIYFGVGTRRQYWAWLLLVTFGLSLYEGASFAYCFLAKRDWGAVVAKQVAVYAGPADKNATVIFELHEGSPFALVDRSGDWVKILISDQKSGWVRSGQVAVFGSQHKILPLLSQSPVVHDRIQH